MTSPSTNKELLLKLVEEMFTTHEDHKIQVAELIDYDYDFVDKDGNPVPLRYRIEVSVALQGQIK